MRRYERFLMFQTVLVMVASTLLIFPAGALADMHKEGMAEGIKQGVHETVEKGKDMAGEAAEGVKDFAAEAEREIRQAADAFRRSMDAERHIPSDLIANAKAIAIFPDVTKAGFMVGGRYGSGVLLFNHADGWNGPLFVDLYGASVGAQIGVERADIFMVFNTEKGLESLKNGELTLGAETSVTAGTWGKKAGFNSKADVIVYKNAEGLFAGASLSGAVVGIDEEANNRYYNREGQERAYYGSEEIFRDQKVPRSMATEDLIRALRDY